MNGMFALAKRNTLCFFRDRSSVVFSLMGVIVVIMLYLLFLKNMLVESYPEIPGMSHLMDSWVLSGILGIVAVTTSAGSLQIMIEDKTGGKIKDIMMAPMRPSHIAAGYIISTFVVGLMMSIITLVIAVVCLVVTGCPVSVGGIAVSVVLLIPSSLSGSVIIYAVTSFLKSTGAFSGFFTVISILIGFLTGIYMPMGTMPGAMNTVCTLLPATHMASLFRQNLGSEALNDIMSSAPAGTIDDFRLDMGYDLSLGSFNFTPSMSIIYVFLISLLFFFIAVVGMYRMDVRKR